MCRAVEPPESGPVERPLPKLDPGATPPPVPDSSKEVNPPPKLKIDSIPALAADGIEPARLEHGRSQVRQLFADRFMMSAYRTAKGDLRKVNENDAIFQWLSRKFAGEDVGEIVFWNSEPPKDSRAAHAIPSWHWPGSVQISRFTAPGEGLGAGMPGFEDLWACGTFEMISLGRVKEHMQLEDRVVDKTISKDAFVEAAAKFEYQSFEALAEFHAKVWQPWANSVGFKTDQRRWRLPLPAYAQWRSAYTDHSSYPWKPFEEIFDDLLKNGSRRREQ